MWALNWLATTSEYEKRAKVIKNDRNLDVTNYQPSYGLCQDYFKYLQSAPHLQSSNLLHRLLSPATAYSPYPTQTTGTTDWLTTSSKPNHTNPSVACLPHYYVSASLSPLYVTCNSAADSFTCCSGTSETGLTRRQIRSRSE